MPRSVRFALVALVVLLGCDDGGDEPTIIGGDAGGAGANTGGGAGCPAGLGRCSGDVYEVCDGASWQPTQTCDGGRVCIPSVGCGDCNPGLGDVCDGDAVRTCESDGRLGDVVATCGAGMCADGRCLDTNDCSPGSELIYLVDDEDNLLTFDPRTDDIARKGRLDCPAGRPWPAWQGDVAHPFSMSVDRQDRAWVLYTSGEIFWIDLRSLDCTRSPWQPGAQGFELFGMGFVTDAPGSARESLFIAGGAVDSQNRGRLARVEPSTMAVTEIGRHARNDYGPELTGNANAELWGYFPGAPAAVARIDKETAGDEQRWPLPALRRDPRGWAFAHWGGRYHIFVSTASGAGGFDSQIHRFDPGTGNAEVVQSNLPWIIVGAGVSTCAPVVSNF